MQITLSKRASEEIIFCKQKYPKLYQKILVLIESIKSTPYTGIGKPEKLKHKLSGYWSRRVDHKHRLVYKVLVEEKTIIIYTCKGHYDDN